ncbi:MAG: SDR family NAD(P)-dependent oxidoreductase [Bacteroidales bacterium]|nr:SDR family NAD(P)-dependent oxidoreductase [Bacteroidales bacterium]
MDKYSDHLIHKTVIITGAARGFGAGIADELSSQGANIIIADIKEEEGKKLAGDLNARARRNRAVFLSCDVSEVDSVSAMMASAVKEFGSIDVLISNAGILRAGSLDEMDADTFEMVTKVNYIGYYNCVKAVIPYMKKQHEKNPGIFMDIIQINSKSGLQGSLKNFAYAGSKFGGVGLTQSFALELIQYNIKVNSICPGNYFEGPLWSDPETGLFRQYLDAGKVPGAKTIEDVRVHYEKQVPMGRGCRVNDVVKAINYVIDQEYETGQAIPVTGGQVMLK